jgi:hypothetical protein
MIEDHVRRRGPKRDALESNIRIHCLALHIPLNVLLQARAACGASSRKPLFGGTATGDALP